jgi:predicted kinase
MHEHPKLYLMLGIPGAGKTTAATIIAELTGAVHMSSDEIRLKLYPHPAFTEHEHTTVYRELNREVERLLAAGKSVVYDANLNRYRHRDEKYQIAAKTKAKTVLIWVKAPEELAKQRRVEEVNRHHLVPPTEDPVSMFHRIVRVFEPPRPNEPYFELDGTAITPDYVRERLGL